MISLARTIMAQVSLLATDPEQLLRNVRQYTHKKRFLSLLVDLPAIFTLQAVPRPGPATVLILMPSIRPSGMTGGPNTALTVGGRLAHAGIPVRFVICEDSDLPDMDWFWRHLSQVTGIVAKSLPVTLCAGRVRPFDIGPDDIVLATRWTTALQAMAMLPLTRRRDFVYLIQDFEPGFYPWSSSYAQALATYALPFHAVINEESLAAFMFDGGHGRFADPAFRGRCTVFEPALDRALFHPGPDVPGRPRRLLVYARPTNPRNLLEIAVAALRQAVAAGVFEGEWELLAIGARGSLPPVPLGGGAVLREAPWRDYAGYAALLRESDIMLSPMLSPHTGYPVLEMAASGGTAVTNHFGAKTVETLTALSPHILAVDPTVDGFAAGLAAAVGRIGSSTRDGTIALPATWDESLAGVVTALRGVLEDKP